MRRLGGPIAAYALIAALALAGPMAVSEEPPAAPTTEAAAPAPATTTEAAPAPAPAPAAEPTPTTEAAPAPEPAPPPAAPAEQPAAEPAAAQPTITDEAAVEKPKKKKVVATAAADTGVTISDFEFSPSGVTVNVGDTVTWNNVGPTPHSATANDGSFDTGILPKGGSGSHTFTQAGTFSYFCKPHPNMKGTITVVAAAADDGDSGSSGGDTGSSGSGSTGDTSATGSTADDGSGLPSTGLDVGGIAVLGLATLTLGAYLRRRTELPPARPSGRIGW